MLELLCSILAIHNDNYKDMPVTIEKAITVCDVITLDRAVHKNMVSVVYFVQRIDPAESDAESEKLRKLLYTLEQGARSKFIWSSMRAIGYLVDSRHGQDDMSAHGGYVKRYLL